MFRLMGFITEFIDISKNECRNRNSRVCPGLSIAKSMVSDSLSCSLRNGTRSSQKTFPGMKASLSKIAEGDCACVFKYERAAQTVTESTKRHQTFFSVIDLVQLVPQLNPIGIKMLRYSQIG